MEKAIYTAMSGAEHALQAQQIHANNLANAGTTGFRADFERVQAYQLQGDTLGARVLAQELPGGTNFSTGALSETGRSLDVAIQGSGYLTVATPEGGEAYTRAGDLTVNADGRLTLHGSAVMGEGGEIEVPDYRDIKIGQDGTVSITPAGSGAQQVVGKLKLVNPDPSLLTKNTQGLLQLTDGSQAAADTNVQLESGFLEGSNVNPIDELISSMSLTRSFELQVKLMESSDSQAKQGNELISG
nr:flagellar basal-body rod protein FlgF [uncultured Tolumonas sp.]